MNDFMAFDWLTLLDNTLKKNRRDEKGKTCKQETFEIFDQLCLYWTKCFLFVCLFAVLL